jgi:hypothetical protein
MTSKNTEIVDYFGTDGYEIITYSDGIEKTFLNGKLVETKKVDWVPVEALIEINESILNDTKLLNQKFYNRLLKSIKTMKVNKKNRLDL